MIRNASPDSYHYTAVAYIVSYNNCIMSSSVWNNTLERDVSMHLLQQEGFQQIEAKRPFYTGLYTFHSPRRTTESNSERQYVHTKTDNYVAL